MDSEHRIAYAYRYGNYFRDRRSDPLLAEREGYDVYDTGEPQAGTAASAERMPDAATTANAGRVALQAQTEVQVLNLPG